MVLADAAADPVLVAADLVTQAEHGPDSPAILVTTDAALADAVEARDRRPAAAARAPRRSSPRALGDHGRIVLAPDLDAAIAFVDAYAPEHLSIDVADAGGGRRPDPQRRARSSSDRGRRSRPATTRPARTTSCRPAASPARRARSSVEAFGRCSQIQRIDRDGLAAIATRSGRSPTAEGLTAHRNAVEAPLPRRREDAGR